MFYSLNQFICDFIGHILEVDVVNRTTKYIPAVMFDRIERMSVPRPTHSNLLYIYKYENCIFIII